MKKVLKCCSALMLALVLVLASGCNPNYRKKFESGDFICIKWGIEKPFIAITDLSEQGKQKRVLIIPEEVNGLKVRSVWDPTRWAGTEWKSEGLEKVYLPWDLNVDLATFRLYFNLSIFIIEFRDLENFVFSSFFRDTNNLYVHHQIHKEFFKLEWGVNPANVTYYYNDGRTENYGCYWLDNVPYGSLLDVLPPENPVSKGKRFAGWFKEPECINAWDFETDTTPAEKLDEDGNVIYQETALYAKWI